MNSSDDIDLELAGLRKLTLRLGDDEAMLAAIEVNDVEPPQLEADFPLSVAIVLPDKTSASLVGDNHICASRERARLPRVPWLLLCAKPNGDGARH